MTNNKKNNELENIVKKEGKKDINLGRIALTTLGYGIIGCFFNDSETIAPITAAFGCTLAVYDEVKQKGLNLSWPAAGIFVGGIVGSLFDNESSKYFADAICYSGAVIGGVLGTYKSYITRKQPKK